jgi:chemotaxis protein MotA
MFSVIGILVVFGAIIGGFLMEKGSLLVLVQPAELVIIGGAAVGTVLVGNPPHILKKLLGGVMGAFGGSRFSQKLYLDSLKMLYDLFNLARRSGLSAIEADIEDPSKSKVFTAYPGVVKDHHVRDFICDTLRTASAGSVEPFDIDQMMELDMEVHHHGLSQPVNAINTMADSLPGLGIVAAVLGVVITMGALGGPPEEIGHHVAAALVGTFLGILMCYGLLGPIAANMAKTADEENSYYHVLRVCLMAFIKGLAPILAVEVGRRAVPGHVRPSFQELEKLCRGSKGAAASSAAA